MWASSTVNFILFFFSKDLLYLRGVFLFFFFLKEMCCYIIDSVGFNGFEPLVPN